MSAALYIGTSGWQYRHWREGFYEGRPQSQWLSDYASHFNALEINASFYRLQSATTLTRWVEPTPPGFTFALKAHRFTTHVRRLLHPQESVRVEQQQAAPLGNKLRVVLWQLPASLGPDLPRLQAFCQALDEWPTVRHCIEFRHPGWFVEPVAQLLGEQGVAVCQSDAADWPLWGCVSTDLVYLRLHGHDQTYASDYGEDALQAWAEQLRGWLARGLTVHCYFDNDGGGAAPANAARLQVLLGG